MQLTLKMHNTTIEIKTETDDLTIDEMFEYFSSALIGCSFTPIQIQNYITDKAQEYDN